MTQIVPKEKAVFNWSGGKDSALGLYKTLGEGKYAVSCLLTTVNQHFQRISMHGVRVQLLENQAASIGLPLVKVIIPEMPDMQTYEAILARTIGDLRRQGITVSLFGDIFLEDLRKYREEKLAAFDLKSIFPLWHMPTHQLMKEFIELGFKAVVVCINEKYLDKSFVGQTIDENFLRDLPKTVDSCGEYGEFHSFVYDGPIFQKRIEFIKGEVVYRKYRPSGSQADHYDKRSSRDNPFEHGFWFCDLIPIGS